MGRRAPRGEPGFCKLNKYKGRGRRLSERAMAHGHGEGGGGIMIRTQTERWEWGEAGASRVSRWAGFRNANRQSAELRGQVRSQHPLRYRI